MYLVSNREIYSFAKVVFNCVQRVYWVTGAKFLSDPETGPMATNVDLLVVVLVKVLVGTGGSCLLSDFPSPKTLSFLDRSS